MGRVIPTLELAPWDLRELFCLFILFMGFSRQESPLHCKEIKPVNPKGNEPRIFIGRTDAEAETLEKILMLRKIEGRRKKGNRG